jgi:micrococcal nuclease
MPKLIIRKIFIIFFVFYSCTDSSDKRPNSKGIRTLSGTCIGISDGDTFTLLSKNKNQFKIRLAHVDCPEKNQPFGSNAKKFTSDFCFGKTLKVMHSGKKDRNGRVIGEVYNEAGLHLNLSLVQAGLAWHFKRYSDNTLFSDEETKAKSNKKGLWVDLNPLPPWEWRNK